MSEPLSPPPLAATIPIPFTLPLQLVQTNDQHARRIKPASTSTTPGSRKTSEPKRQSFQLKRGCPKLHRSCKKAVKDAYIGFRHAVVATRVVGVEKAGLVKRFVREKKTKLKVKKPTKLSISSPIYDPAGCTSLPSTSISTTTPRTTAHTSTSTARTSIIVRNLSILCRKPSPPTIPTTPTTPITPIDPSTLSPAADAQLRDAVHSALGFNIRANSKDPNTGTKNRGTGDHSPLGSPGLSRMSSWRAPIVGFQTPHWQPSSPAWPGTPTSPGSDCSPGSPDDGEGWRDGDGEEEVGGDEGFGGEGNGEEEECKPLIMQETTKIETARASVDRAWMCPLRRFENVRGGYFDRERGSAGFFRLE